MMIDYAGTCRVYFNHPSCCRIQPSTAWVLADTVHQKLDTSLLSLYHHARLMFGFQNATEISPTHKNNVRSFPRDSNAFEGLYPDFQATAWIFFSKVHACMQLCVCVAFGLVHVLC